MKRSIVVLLLVSITSCTRQNFKERIKTYDYWLLPICFNEGILIDNNDLSAPTDWGFVYRVRVDSSCAWEVIKMNNMEQLNSKNNVTYIKHFKKSEGVEVGFYVNLDKQELVFSYLEE
jgi:hypothetical protein